MDIPEIPNLIHYAIPVFVITILSELIIAVYIQQKKYDYKDALTSISMGIGNVAVGLLAKGLSFGFLVLCYQFRIFDIPFTWWAWILVFFAEDFTYYWSHRIGHESRFFWASHVVHHSSRKYNLSTAVRQTWTGAFTGFFFTGWLAILGFHPIMIATQGAINLLYQYWIHTEMIKKLPKWFEFVFNTPSHHRVHHATNPQYLDRNHAGTLIIWDRMFGTFEPEVEKPVYGLTENIDTHNPLKVAFHEWIAIGKDLINNAKKPKDVLNYLFRPPGWKHDGTGKLSKDLRREYEVQKKLDT